MPFDLTTAREDGLAEDKIVDFLATKDPAFDLVKARADKVPENEIADFLVQGIGQPEVKGESGFLANVKTGWKQGVESSQAMAYGGVGLAADIVGRVLPGDDKVTDAVRDWGLKGFKRNLEEAAQYKPSVSKFTDIDWSDIDSLVDWVAYTGGSLAPSVLEMAGGAAIGGMIGGAATGGLGAAPAAAMGAAGRGAIKTYIRNLAAKKLKTEVFKDLAKEKGVKVARDAALKAVGKNIGASIGVVEGTALLEGGGMWGDAAKKMGVENASPWSALGLAHISGVSEAIAPGGGVAKKLGLLGSDGVKLFARDMVAGAGRKLFTRLGIKIPAYIVKEGGQEAFQGILSKVHEKIVDPDVSLTDKEALYEYFNQFAAGGLGGFGFGAMGAITTKPTSDQEYYQNKVNNLAKIPEERRTAKQRRNFDEAAAKLEELSPTVKDERPEAVASINESVREQQKEYAKDVHEKYQQGLISKEEILKLGEEDQQLRADIGVLVTAAKKDSVPIQAEKAVVPQEESEVDVAKPIAEKEEAPAVTVMADAFAKAQEKKKPDEVKVAPVIPEEIIPAVETTVGIKAEKPQPALFKPKALDDKRIVVKGDAAEIQAVLKGRVKYLGEISKKDGGVVFPISQKVLISEALVAGQTKQQRLSAEQQVPIPTAAKETPPEGKPLPETSREITIKGRIYTLKESTLSGEGRKTIITPEGDELTQGVDSEGQTYYEAFGDFAKAGADGLLELDKGKIAEKFKEVLAAATETLPEKLAEAVGKPGQVATLTQMGVTGEQAQVEEIVTDAVTQKLDIAKALEAKGKDAIAGEVREEGLENAETLLDADGVVTEKAVREALAEEGVKPNKEPPKAEGILFAKKKDKPLKAILQKWEENGVKLSVLETDNLLKINTIIVPIKDRKAGVGTQILKEISAYADSVGKKTIVQPAIKGDFQGTTSQARLKRFYKRFGFVENKGRNKDFTVNAGDMYREPLYSKTTTPTGSTRKQIISDVKSFFGRKKIPSFIRVVQSGGALPKSFDWLMSVKEASKKITDNPNFIEWFGDSKVVNDDGEPLVVYHGTETDWGTYDSSWGGTGGWAKEGLIAANAQGKNAVLVSTTSEEHAAFYGDVKKELYVRVMNPLVIDGKGDLETWAIAKEGVSSAQEMIDSYGDFYDAAGLDSIIFDAVVEAKKKGKDGVIIKYGDLVDAEGWAIGDIVLTFEPTQIKSIYNRGTFDPKDLRILYSKDNQTIQGYYAPKTKQITLIADAITPGEVRPLLVHEGIHKLLRDDPQFQKQYKHFLSQVDRLGAMPPNTKEALAVQKAIKRVTDAGTPGDIFTEEVLAYYLQDAANKNLSLYRRVMTVIKNTLLRLGFPAARIKFSGEEMAFLMTGRLRGWREAGGDSKGNSNSGRKGAIAEFAQSVLMSVKEASKKITDSPSFVKWFGESQVVAANGDPLILYHGTNQDGDILESYRSPGIWFTDNRRNASGYGEFFHSVYLKTENPLIVEFTGKDVDEGLITIAGEEFESNDDIVEYAEAKGFDGVDFLEGNFTEDSKTVVVFEPTQIKSIFNKGTFDQKDPRILYSKKQTAATKIFDEAAGSVENIKYADYYDRGMPLHKKVAGELSSLKDDAAKITDQFLGAISTRLGNIGTAGEALKSKFRRLDADTGFKTVDRMKVLGDFHKAATKKIKTRHEEKRLDIALKHSDVAVLEEIMKKYGLEKEYKAVRALIDQLDTAGRDLGLSFGKIDEYWPRVLKDEKGYLRALKKGKEWANISKAIAYAEQELNYTARKDGSADEVLKLTEEQKGKIAEQVMSGVRNPMGGIPSTKRRQIKVIPPELDQFYMTSFGAMESYIRNMTEALEKRAFFGRSKSETKKAGEALAKLEEKKANIPSKATREQAEDLDLRIKMLQTKMARLTTEYDFEQDIASFVIKEIGKGGIRPDREQTLTDILQARFSQESIPGKLIGTYRDLSYIDTMGSVISAVTQIGDLPFALYDTGPKHFIKGFGKALFRKERLTKEDIGLEHIGQEMSDPNWTSSWLRKVFTLTGLTWMDSLGKETLVNAALSKYKTQVSTIKGEAQFRKEFKSMKFRDGMDATIRDLKTGLMTEDVKFLVLSRLADFQPVLKAEMPEKYLTAGNGRIFYMLKSFTLKQWDIYRREGFQQMFYGKTVAERAQGARNLAHLGVLLVFANAGADEIKDWMLGRKTDFSDRVWDNVFRMAGFSKFIVWQARMEGIGTAAAKQILPPFKFANALWKDTTKAGDGGGLEMVGSVPVGGKLYYWWFGRGKTKRKSLLEIRFSKKKKHLKDIKTRYDKAEDKAKFRVKYGAELRERRRIIRVQGRLSQLTARINKTHASTRLSEAAKKLRITQLEERQEIILERYMKKYN